MKKIALLIMTLMVIGLIGFYKVKADSETFSLTMGTVQYFYSEPGRFVEGNFFVEMTFDRWYNSSCTSGQVKVALHQRGSSRALGSIQRNINMYSTLYYTFGYFDNTEKYYEFERLSCGWRSNMVRIGS